MNSGFVQDIRWNMRLERDATPNAADTSSPPDTHAGFRSGPDDGFSVAESLANSDTTSSDPGHDEHSTLHTSESTPNPPHQDSDEDGDQRNPHAWVGISLITGFILMYLIDTLPAHISRSPQPQSLQINLNQFSFTRTPSDPSASEEPETPSASTFPSSGGSGRSSRPSSTTLGLVIHAAADGIALGASSTAPPARSLNFVIFLALMLHKAPAAFGLTSVLLKQNLSKRSARAHLIVFSAAAPVGALLTWAVVNLLGYGSGGGAEGAGGTEFATGVLLLFSGGTFLYVAVHVMQESGGGHEHGGGQGNGYAEVPMGLYEEQGSAVGGGSGKGEEKGVIDVLVTVLGMVLPLLTQFGHAH